ncbi:hypothetical protein LEP1GSC041_0156 [Leptospira noguchii str. 2006001870]|nr:hypothetical protein LEP1GSC041_0156 [Leptospira noguchii str. 2006001870]EMO26646.1 hypothetical protein LEP1GSC170_5808 [Leptospira interrogans serovar Bataviae str. HAI135]
MICSFKFSKSRSMNQESHNQFKKIKRMLKIVLERSYIPKDKRRIN